MEGLSFLSSSYKGYLQDLLRNHYQAEKGISDALWVEPGDGVEDKNAFKRGLENALSGGHYTRIRLLLQSPDIICQDPLFIYETLSYLIEVSQRDGLTLIFLPLAHERREDLKRLTLFLIDEIQSKDAELEQPGVYEFSGELLSWDPRRFRLRCASRLALWIIHDQKEKEQQGPSLLKYMRRWRSSPAAFFEGLRQGWVDEIFSLLRGHKFLVGWWGFVRRFGAGRRDGHGDVARMLNPTYNRTLFNPEAFLSDSSSADSNIHLLLHRVECPTSRLLEEIWELRRLLSAFYQPTLTGLDTIGRIQFESGYTPPPFQTELWRRANQEFISSIEQIYALLNVLRGSPQRDERRSTTRQLRRNLRALLRRLRDNVDREIMEVLNLQDLVLASPERFRNAYTEFYRSSFAAIIRLFSELWGIRRFLGIPLPPRIPSLFYPLRAPLRLAIGLLRHAIRLLNFYHAAHIVFREYRDTLVKFYQQLDDIQRSLPGYGRHTENVVKELEVRGGDEMLTLAFDPEEMNIKDIQRAPEAFPQMDIAFERLKEEVGEGLKGIVDELVVGSRASKEGRESSGRSPFVVFTPAYFHKREAWAVAEEMVRAIEREGTFQALINSYIQESGLDPDSLLSYYKKENRKIGDPIQEGIFRRWKKKALESSNRPLSIDILKPWPHNQKEAMEFIISKGEETRFWQRKNGRLGLTVDVFRWASRSIRILFFQRRQGLSLQELETRATDSQAAALCNWFFWLLKEENGYFSQEDRERLPKSLLQTSEASSIVRTIFRTLMTNYFSQDPPEHGQFGVPEIINRTYFMLLNTYHEDLMKLFSPDAKEDCRARLFTEGQIEGFLSQEKMLSELLGLFFDYALVKDLEGIIDEFIQRGFFSRQDKGL